VTTFFIGYTPSIIKQSKKSMNLLAIFGAGLLIGAALEIIVPEGMQVLNQSMNPHSPNLISQQPQNGR